MSKQQHSQDSWNKTIQACVTKSIGLLMSRMQDMVSELQFLQETIIKHTIQFNDLLHWLEFLEGDDFVNRQDLETGLS
jgi:hypothetical protein